MELGHLYTVSAEEQGGLAPQRVQLADASHKALGIVNASRKGLHVSTTIIKTGILKMMKILSLMKGLCHGRMRRDLSYL